MGEDDLKKEESSDDSTRIDRIGVFYESELEPENRDFFVVPSDKEIKSLSKQEHPNFISNKAAVFTIKQKGFIGLKARSARHKINLKLSSVRQYQTGVASILILCLVLFTSYKAFGAKSQVETLTASAQEHLVSAFDSIESGDVSRGLEEADQAKDDIGQLKLLVQSWGQDIKYLSLVPGHSSRLVAYERFLNSIYAILSALSDFEHSLKVSFANSVASTSDSGIPTADLVLIQTDLEIALARAKDRLESSKKELEKTSSSMPNALAQESKKAIDIIDKLDSTLDQTGVFVKDGLPWLSGDGGTRRILILFQNNTEIRGSGGFIGSFAVASFSDGKLADIEFETNIYKLDKAFSAHTKVAIPNELETMAESWAMRDSNLAIDGPESFSRVMEFYELESGKKVDGVMALDTTLFIDLLRIVGPIDMPEFGKTIGYDNFLKDVQYEVERGYFERDGSDVENEPKKILAVMMPIFINRLFDGFGSAEKSNLMLEALGRGLKEKHMLLNFKNSSLQEMLEKLDYAGKVEHMLADYLFVHNTNIGGAKSSLNVKELVKYQVDIAGSGEIKSRVEINRKHNGDGNWPDGANVNLIRVLLPQNSTIDSFSNISGSFWPHNDKKYSSSRLYETGEEAGKTKISFWQNTEPGKSSKSSFEYAPNYRVETSAQTMTYKLYLQKQPGSIGDDYEIAIKYPANYKPINVKNYDAINHRILIRHTLLQDKEFSVEFEKIKK
ncbi:MAG: DUF4012 domain-containing protein [Patescibacteria group bacterium]